MSEFITGDEVTAINTSQYIQSMKIRLTWLRGFAAALNNPKLNECVRDEDYLLDCLAKYVENKNKEYIQQMRDQFSCEFPSYKQEEKK